MQWRWLARIDRVGWGWLVGPSAAAQSSYFGQIEGGGGGKERGSGKKSGAVAEIWPLAKLCCAALQDIFVLLVLKRSFMVGKEGGEKT